MLVKRMIFIKSNFEFIKRYQHDGMNENEVIFWFRRDLRLEDNAGLWQALSSGYKVIPVFIFDTEILGKLEPDDARVSFIFESINNINRKLKTVGSEIYLLHGTPEDSFKILISTFRIKGVYINRDYEPYSIKRDSKIQKILETKRIPLFSFKDQVIFEKSDIVKDNGKPYTVYTSYSKRWLKEFEERFIEEIPSSNLIGNFKKMENHSVSIESIGFKKSTLIVSKPELSESSIINYNLIRDIPSAAGTSMVGPHLRFGTMSIREVMRKTNGLNIIFTKELIWREFFMQILFHFPHVEEGSFRPEYDRILWVNNEESFDKWCAGETGFPFVDAGMRELNKTGYMHNRVRMVTANFLTRHLLTDWRWGEAWFAGKLLDYELSSNNGNWQWSAGTGCDAAPYFRIFNPELQVKKFDPELTYIKNWIPEFGTNDYPSPIVDHSFARNRAINYYKAGIKPL
jgi:deoxyribodipyrimidine photo-lyase